METNQNQMNAIISAAAQEAAQQQPAQPVQQPEEPSMDLQLRAQELITQARTIWAIAQVDVLAVYNTDVEIRSRILGGTMDFIDVYKMMKPVHTPPAPVRSANGASGAMNIGAMNEQQFTKLNEMLSKGAKVDMRY